MSEVVRAGSYVRVRGRVWYGRPVEVECKVHTDLGALAFCAVVTALSDRLRCDNRGVRRGSVYVLIDAMVDETYE